MLITSDKRRVRLRENVMIELGIGAVTESGAEKIQKLVR